MVDYNYIVVLVYQYLIFTFLLMILLWILSSKRCFLSIMGFFSSIESFRSWRFCIVVISDSETALNVFENFRFIICFVLLFLSFSVFVLLNSYPFVC